MICVRDLSLVHTVVGRAPHVSPGLGGIPRLVRVVYVGINKARARRMMVPETREDKFLRPVHVLVVLGAGIVLVEPTVQAILGVGTVGIPAIHTGKRAIAMRFEMFGKCDVLGKQRVLLAQKRQVVRQRIKARVQRDVLGQCPSAVCYSVRAEYAALC